MTGHPLGSGGVPAQARSPPTLTRAPLGPCGEELGDDEIGGQSLADAARIEGDAGWRRHGPLFGVDGDGGQAADVQLVVGGRIVTRDGWSMLDR